MVNLGVHGCEDFTPTLTLPLNGEGTFPKTEKHCENPDSEPVQREVALMA